MRLSHWPARWKQRRRVIYYRPRPEEREKYDGKHWFPLGRTEQEAFTTWFRMQDGIVVPRSINDAVALYQGSKKYLKLATSTRKDYDRALSDIRETFGHMRPQDLMPSDVYQWMATKPDVTANRQRVVLKNVMQICVKHGPLMRNPVKEVERNTEEPRDRYVEDWEIDAFINHGCTPFLKAYVVLKYITGLRQAQMLALRVSDWDGAELYGASVKRGRAAEYFGQGLKEAVESAMAVRKGKFQSIYIFSTRRGRQYTGDGFRSLWQYAMWKYLAWVVAEKEAELGRKLTAAEASAIKEEHHFTEHDIRAKTGSDSEDLPSAQARLQHQNASTTKRVYRRKPAKVKVLKR